MASCCFCGFTTCVCFTFLLRSPYYGPHRADLWLSDCAVDPDCYCKDTLENSLRKFLQWKQPSDTTWSSWKRSFPVSYCMKCILLVQLTLYLTFSGSHCGLSHVACCLHYQQC